MAAHGRLTVAAILVAAGSGLRLGADVPKAFCMVAGKTLLEHAAGPFLAHPDVAAVVIVAAADRVATAADLVPGASVVVGGASRQESVACGLAVLRPEIDTVLVHDVARPFVPPDVISRVLAALAAGAVAVVPAVPIADTIKRVEGGEVTGTVDRASLCAVQTPQGFRLDVLRAAHAGSVGTAATDDAALVEAAGQPVVVVAGADEAFKITRPWDLRIAEAVLR
jgi:2-C-methyl-D-erythritol 4-phosphate cytidylyltransferase